MFVFKYKISEKGKINMEQKEFIRKIYIDKAKITMKGIIVVIVISLLTYVIPLIEGVFDFGIIFEVISFVFVWLAKNALEKYNEVGAKKYTILAMIPVGWILIYDGMIFLLQITNLMDFMMIVLGYFYEEFLLLFFMLGLFSVYRDLAKADNPAKYKGNTDWFYEKYEGNGENKNLSQ